MSEVVALLLDDAMPPERLGALLLAARKRSGLKRKQAAAAAGTTAAKLRKYEHGDRAVPAGVCAQLAECYGDDLTAHVPLRVPLQISSDTLTMGDTHQPIGPDVDDVIAGYIDIVSRLRSTGPGDPLSLRTVDIMALAGALGRDRATIEARIAEVLGCTPTEARRLHGELLRRKVILPVAGLAAGMAAFAGVAYAAHSPASSTHVQTRTLSAQPSSPVTPTTVTTPTTATPPTTAPATTPATTAKPVSRTHIKHVTAPTTTPAPKTDATVPVKQRQAEVPVSVAPPQANPDDPPVSVLPGETPITVIGSPDSTSDTTP
jgi:transcriptional regulator with XRE-family HTH domain